MAECSGIWLYIRCGLKTMQSIGQFWKLHAIQRVALTRLGWSGEAVNFFNTCSAISALLLLVPLGGFRQDPLPQLLHAAQLLRYGRQ